jgi:hypothetical protein
MKKLTREQIDERLKLLRESRANEESYFSTRPAMAMCYMPSVLGRKSAKRKCEKCGKEFTITWTNYDHETIEKYDMNVKDLEGYTRKSIVAQFKEIGMDAKLVCYCDGCASKGHRFEMWIKSPDEKEWHKSIPSIGHYYEDEGAADRVSDFEYGLVLKFLSAPIQEPDLCSFFDQIYNVKFRVSEKNFFADKPPIDFKKESPLTLKKAINLIKNHTGFDGKAKTAMPGSGTNFIFNRFIEMFSDEYRDLSYKGIISDDSMHYDEDAGFIKTQIDRALHKILGLNIIYDKDEIKRNIEYYVSQAFEIFDETGKDKFTFAEYSAFMKRCILSLLGDASTKGIQDTLRKIYD